MRRVALLLALLAVALPGAALAVWGGQEDVSHPSVGAMYFDVQGNGVAVPDGLFARARTQAARGTGSTTCS